MTTLCKFTELPFKPDNFRMWARSTVRKNTIFHLIGTAGRSACRKIHNISSPYRLDNVGDAHYFGVCSACFGISEKFRKMQRGTIVEHWYHGRCVVLGFPRNPDKEVILQKQDNGEVFLDEEAELEVVGYTTDQFAKTFPPYYLIPTGISATRGGEPIAGTDDGGRYIRGAIGALNGEEPLHYIFSAFGELFERGHSDIPLRTPHYLTYGNRKLTIVSASDDHTLTLKKLAGERVFTWLAV